MSRTASTLSSLLDHPQLDWVEPVASALQEKASAVFSQQPVGSTLKSFLNGTPIRHRIHPALVDVPVGAWTTSFYLDVLSTLMSGRNKRHFEAGSDAAIALGIAGSLPAALSGTADWVDLHGKSRRYGTVHALLNTVALASYSVSLIARRGNNRNQALALTAGGIGFTALTISAAIGGDLVYNLGVNIPTRPEPSPPEDFTYVMDSGDLGAGEHRMVEAGELPILLTRDESGEIRALQHWCPHAGAPLSDGEIEDHVITCPWHGSQFCVDDGSPLRGPAATPLTVYSVREENGQILVGPPA